MGRSRGKFRADKDPNQRSRRKKNAAIGENSESGAADPQLERKRKKPTSLENDDPSLVELSGYNPKRQEFDPEYDNDAEQLVAEMEFKDTDTEEEQELKLRVLRIYSKRLEERKRRKDFILERNLLYPNPFERDLSPEERAICRKYDLFMRFHSKEEHEELMRTVVSEHRARKRIDDLKEAQAAGCCTSAEADRWLEQKRRGAEESAPEANGSAQVGARNLGPSSVFMPSDSAGKDTRVAGPAAESSSNEMDVTGYYGANLLSETEKRLCCELRLLPALYLKMQQIVAVQIMYGKVNTKAEAHHLFKMEASKIDRVYDILVKKGIAPP